MATLLNISEAAALGLHAAGHLAVRRGQVMSARALAAACGASEAHMIKVCQRLSRCGLLTARRGVGGGFRLAKSASRIRLVDVYEAIEGTIRLRPCLFRNHDCGSHAGHECAFGQAVRELEGDFLDYLKSTTLAEIAKNCGGKAAA
jgi:Rrf2 family protein